MRRFLLVFGVLLWPMLASGGTQIHATDCTSLACDPAQDGEFCYEEDADTLYVCEGTEGAGIWKSTSGSDCTNNCTFTGTTDLQDTPIATTPAADDNDTSIATTAYVQTEIGAENHLGSDLSSSGQTITTDHTNDELIISSSDTGAAFKFEFGVAGQLRLLDAGSPAITSLRIGSWDLFTDGAIDHLKTTFIQTGAGPRNIPASVQGGRWYIANYAAGVVTFTIGAGSTGNHGCIYDLDGGNGVIVDVDASDELHLPGTGGIGVGDKIQTTGGPAAGDHFCYVNIDGTNIIMHNVTGAWADGGP